MERLGIVDELREKQDAVASRLSPAARHQAFPTRYARPLPREATVIADPTPPLRKEIADLKARLAEAQRENTKLLALVADLGKPKDLRHVPMRSVMDAFVDAMNAANITAGSERWSHDLLVRICRAPAVSRPRMVCIWLVRKICAQPSLPMIGKEFGGKDHTTIMHALERAPQVMALNPDLRGVAASVLSTFAVCAALLERGGRP